jgi:hypothetical protein
METIAQWTVNLKKMTHFLKTLVLKNRLKFEKSNFV